MEVNTVDQLYKNIFDYSKKEPLNVTDNELIIYEQLFRCEIYFDKYKVTSFF